jgi:RNA polymerase sigma-70 factor (ECF subfamily)
VAAGIRAAGSSSSEARSEPFAQDHLLAQRAAHGDARAQKQLALRLVARIRRAAHALMGGASEADDATHHALVEVLRSLSGYTGAGSLEAWADRLSARSIVRYARAVRARASAPPAAPKSNAPAISSVPAAHVVDEAEAAPKESERPERAARTLEEFLRQLPSAPREALLLREVFGFDLVQSAQLLRLSASALREQLDRARHGLSERTLGQALAAEEPLPEPLTRWFALRDAELRPGSGADQAESAEARLARVSAEAGLHDDPGVRKLQRELRSLAQFLDAGRFNRPGAKDKKLVEGALSALRVSSVAPARELLREHGRSAPDWDAAHWVHPVSIGLCGALVVGSFVALALHTPNPRGARLDPAERSAAPEVVTPTVQALSTAHSVDRRARLQRAGQALAEGAIMHEGDIVSAAQRPGCFVLSPPVDVCLAPGSKARIARLGLTERTVELLSGRTAVSVERVADAARPAEGIPFAIGVGELRAEVTDADFGVEIDADNVVVRALRGTLLLSADGETHLLAPAQSAIYRTQERKLEIVPQLIEKARRDWDLLAARVPTSDHAQARAATAGGTRATKPAAEEQALGDGGERGLEELALELEPEPEPEPELAADAPPEALMERARQLSRERRWQEAIDGYALLAQRHPQHPLTREAWVLQGEILAERVQRPADALGVFDRYLASGGGALDIRARYGRIVALRLLGRPADEQAAVAQFLTLYRSTPQARVLLSAAETEAPAAIHAPAQGP